MNQIFVRNTVLLLRLKLSSNLQKFPTNITFCRNFSKKYVRRHSRTVLSLNRDSKLKFPKIYIIPYVFISYCKLLCRDLLHCMPRLLSVTLPIFIFLRSRLGRRANREGFFLCLSPRKLVSDSHRSLTRHSQSLLGNILTKFHRYIVTLFGFI